MRQALTMCVLVLLGLTAFSAPVAAKPTTVWGAICSSQSDIRSCCSNMHNSCMSGCDARKDCFYFEAAHCPCYNTCKGNYNRCVAQDLRRPDTGVTGGIKKNAPNTR